MKARLPWSLDKLMSTLKKAQRENRLERQMQLLTCPRVLVLDDIGYLPMEPEEASLFFRLVTRRYEKGSAILTSNKNFIDWGEVFGDQAIVTAILDRLLHHSTTLNIKGDNYRLKEKRKPSLLTLPPYATKNRVRAGLSPTLPTAPGMRVRTGRFTEDGET